MRAREIRAMVRELETEERALVEQLSKIRSALDFLKLRASIAEAQEAAPGRDIVAEVSAGLLDAKSSPIFSPVLVRVGGGGTFADLIDRVLDAHPINAREITRRVAALPEAPPEVKPETIRWNLSNKYEDRGWVRTGTKAHALWSKPVAKTANG